MRFLTRIKEGLAKTRDKIRSGLSSIFGLKRKIDGAILSQIEETLYTADVGVEEVGRLMTFLQNAYREGRIEDTDQLLDALKAQMKQDLEGASSAVIEAARPPTVILVVGVNGSGKTTSIAKLAKYYMDDGKKVLLGACDTFRAAAIDQLEVWASRVGADMVRHKPGSDPASVAYDAADASLSRGIDVLIIDTAGRLHTKDHLMRELDKIVRVLKKRIPEAPHETLLCLDATTGQNGLAQAKTFKQLIGLTGVFLAKLDGTAKGGIVLAIQNQIKVPVKFVGIGEKPDDIEPFNNDSFVEALFEA
jgi:fused signal recognition particle receptor